MFFSSLSLSNENPLADNKITCEEMDSFPELVFRLDDLGSGYGSPNEVDYSCPKSLSQLDFLQGIIEQAGSIRAPNRNCDGSIIYAQWRYYQFSLSELGYFPQGSSFRSSGKINGMEYFKEWSYESLYNREVYTTYLKEIEVAKPKLVDWYIQNHAVDKKIAKKYADIALQKISNYGFGSYTYTWGPEPLVPFTEEAIKGDFAKFLPAISVSSTQQKLNTLRRLLTHEAPTQIIEKLISTMAIESLYNRWEPILSSSVKEPFNIKALLNAGYRIDTQNKFGKTALFYAIQFNQHDSVKVLLSYGANVNHIYNQRIEDQCSRVEQWGRTPLMHAAQHSDIDMLNLLLNNGANIHAKDIKESKAFDYAKNNNKKENASFLMKMATSAEYTNITFNIIMADLEKKAVVTKLVQKAIQKSDLITVNPKRAFSHLYIIGSQDISDNVNPNGWTFAVAHINNSSAIQLIEKMESEGVLQKGNLLKLVGGLVQEQGFLKHLNIAHSSSFKHEYRKNS
jgi:hypothetical protein